MSDIPYEDQFKHIEGGEYEFLPQDMGPGSVERAGSFEAHTAQQARGGKGQGGEGEGEGEEGLEEGDEEEPPKMLACDEKGEVKAPQVYRSTSGAKGSSILPGKEGGREGGKEGATRQGFARGAVAGVSTVMEEKGGEERGEGGIRIQGTSSGVGELERG
ncbi:Hypothetical protein NocV09_03900160 [Nannochloropsis oceanica]